MLILFYILSALSITASALPFVPNQHWIFRIWEFGRIQILVLQFFTLLLGLFFIDTKDLVFWTLIILNAGLIINHTIILAPYTTLYKIKDAKTEGEKSKSVSIISVNVYQFNDNYQKLIDLVNNHKPDILLTIESNEAWEKALTDIEDNYPNYKKVPLENTYGMHFYTRLKMKSVQVNYYIADDLPSIEAALITEDGLAFTFFGIHPPPPSPTEEETAKERDGELLAVGKKIKKTDGPVIIVGDFNNVAWANSSKLFRKTSELIDPRIGRGFVSTYHAKYRLLRFPIDLFFHSPDIIVEDFKTLEPIDSDHLPLFCKFSIVENKSKINEEVETLEAEEKEEVDELIEEGKEETSDREAEVKD